MANVLKGLFGAKPADTPSQDADFADFASPPDPSPVPLTADGTTRLAGSFATSQAVPYTAWYRVWERTSPSDFIAEAFVIPLLLLVLGFSLWGRRTNRTKARNWAAAHSAVLQKEFAQVGFARPAPSGAQSAVSQAAILPDDVIAEKNADEYISYATGRQNVAFVDFHLQLFKRYSPLSLLFETALAFFFSMFKMPVERVESIAYPFNGKEKEVIPVRTEEEQAALEARVKDLASTYDDFVWAVVNKDNMRQLRDDRYDISLTFTKDNAKLPDWATVMSESGEITDQLLSPELIKVITQAGPDNFEYLIISDQPVDKPLKINETIPRKRISLSMRLPSSSSQSAYVDTIPLFSYFLRLPDLLVSSAHYRPEILRRVKAIREEEIRKLRKLEDEEKAEERKTEADKRKKDDRDRRLKGLSAEEQRKFLEKEREKEQRKMGKKRTVKA